MMIVCLLLCLFLILSFLVYASYSIQSGIYLRSFCKKRTTEKVVALTFDDGPDPIQTPKVLKVLKEYQATACFFCIGHKIKGNEALLKSMVTEGHLIGNHSYSHSGLFPLYGLSKMKKDRWIGIASAVVDKIDYAASGGVANAESVVKAILAGASAVEVCSAVYLNTNAFIGEANRFLSAWMERKGFENIAQFKGKLNIKDIKGVNTFERTQFLKYFGKKE